MVIMSAFQAEDGGSIPLTCSGRRRTDKLDMLVQFRSSAPAIYFKQNIKILRKGRIF